MTNPVPSRFHAIVGLRDILLSLEHFRHVTAGKLKLNISDLSALTYLRSGGEVGQTELASYLGLSTSAVTSLIDRLQARKLVARRPHPNDRRRTVVELTPHGAQMVDRARDRFISAMERVPDAHLGAAAMALSVIAAELSAGAESVPLPQAPGAPSPAA